MLAGGVSFVGRRIVTERINWKQMKCYVDSVSLVVQACSRRHVARSQTALQASIRKITKKLFAVI